MYLSVYLIVYFSMVQSSGCTRAYVVVGTSGAMMAHLARSIRVWSNLIMTISFCIALGSFDLVV
jgi:hypothetical protein